LTNVFASTYENPATDITATVSESIGWHESAYVVKTASMSSMPIAILVQADPGFSETCL